MSLSQGKARQIRARLAINQSLCLLQIVQLREAEKLHRAAPRTTRHFFSLSLRVTTLACYCGLVALVVGARHGAAAAAACSTFDLFFFSCLTPSQIHPGHLHLLALCPASEQIGPSSATWHTLRQPSLALGAPLARSGAGKETRVAGIQLS